MGKKEQIHRQMLEKFKHSELINNPEVARLVGEFEFVLNENEAILSRERDFRKTALIRISMFMRYIKNKELSDSKESKQKIRDLICDIEKIAINNELDDIDTIFSHMDKVKEILTQYINKSEIKENKLKEMLSEIRNETKQYKKMSYIDSLTSIANRRFGDKYIDRLVKNKNNFSYIVLDIDHFKKVNDKFGHQTGDELLYQASQKMKHLIGKQGIICRTGGEEFAIVLREGVDPVILASNLRLEIEESVFLIGNNKHKITISCGVSFILSDGSRFREIADERLYIAKRTGRNKVIS